MLEYISHHTLILKTKNSVRHQTWRYDTVYILYMKENTSQSSKARS